VIIRPELDGLGEDAAADALWLEVPEPEVPVLEVPVLEGPELEVPVLEAAGFVADELAVLIPAEHAVADRLAAQVARTSAAKR
jgi:hypothetical protein